MRVAVTGGSGFIAGYVMEELAARDYTPVAFDRYNKMNVPFYAEYFQGDITNETDVTELMAHVDAWIHLAGVLGTAETINNPVPAAETNILGGLNVFQAAAQYKVPGVNIAVGNHWMNNTYSITKSTMERFAHMYNAERDTQISIVRALNAYGPRQVAAPPHGPSKVKKIMPAFINSALDGDPIVVYGDGEQVMDMIYVSDVARVLVDALEHTWEYGALNRVVEAGSGVPTTVNQIASEVIKATRSEAGVKHIDMRPGEPRGSVVLGHPETLSVLDIIPSEDFVTLSSGVSRTVEYYRSVRDKR